ncbi:cytochrome o ubiquinol oxidase subunit IV [Rhizobium halophytocola]|uniref:Cytochrome bo(3) ubiquinol oxidase subunit 4 n=1 Tax=Rhizobium halophytocola TaxID=735519 RepID=A0ABS4DWZ3_9HYPH|nr:cytochrome o ubiquinol oxidase subunit IV [Rhizobium halophytocola]MBP1850190.1 cytochrome o ubiquinol oxidase operon protein cyoD [Rhizobium halophytocola]
MSDHSTHSTASHGTFSQLMVGFALAAVLTLIPFGLIIFEVEITKTMMIGIIMGLGAVQIIVHLVYFLHLNSASEEGWTLTASIFALIVLLIVLAGSLWVMHNMNEHMMPMGNVDASQMMQTDPEAQGIAPSGESGN